MLQILFGLVFGQLIKRCDVISLLKSLLRKLTWLLICAVCEAVTLLKRSSFSVCILHCSFHGDLKPFEFTLQTSCCSISKSHKSLFQPTVSNVSTSPNRHFKLHKDSKLLGTANNLEQILLNYVVPILWIFCMDFSACCMAWVLVLLNPKRNQTLHWLHESTPVQGDKNIVAL